MIRSEYAIGMFSNKWLLGALAMSIILVLAIVYTPLSEVFHTTPLSVAMWEDVLIYVGITTVVGIGMDYLINRFVHKKQGVILVPSSQMLVFSFLKYHPDEGRIQCDSQA